MRDGGCTVCQGRMGRRIRLKVGRQVVQDVADVGELAGSGGVRVWRRRVSVYTPRRRPSVVLHRPLGLVSIVIPRRTRVQHVQVLVAALQGAVDDVSIVFASGQRVERRGTPCRPSLSVHLLHPVILCSFEVTPVRRCACVRCVQHGSYAAQVETEVRQVCARVVDIVAIPACVLLRWVVRLLLLVCVVQVVVPGECLGLPLLCGSAEQSG